MVTLFALAALGLAAGLAAAAWIYARQQRDRARRAYQEQLEAALADGILTAEELRELDALRARTELSDPEARMVALVLYRRLLRAAMEDARVTEGEDAMLRRLRQQLGLTDADLRADREALQRLRLLARIERNDFPVIEPPFPIAEEEACHWVVRATICHRLEIPGGTRQPPAGLEFALEDAAALEVDGPRSPLADNPEILPVDAGMLVVTSRRTIFRGAKRRIQVPHLQLRRLVLFQDALRLELAGASHTLLVDDAALTAALLLRVARRRQQQLGDTTPRRA